MEERKQQLGQERSQKLVDERKVSHFITRQVYQVCQNASKERPVDNGVTFLQHNEAIHSFWGMPGNGAPNYHLGTSKRTKSLSAAGILPQDQVDNAAFMLAEHCSVQQKPSVLRRPPDRSGFDRRELKESHETSRNLFRTVTAQKIELKPSEISSCFFTFALPSSLLPPKNFKLHPDFLSTCCIHLIAAETQTSVCG